MLNEYRKITGAFICVGVAMILAMATTGASAADLKWDMPNEYGASSLPGLADKIFAKKVAEKTGGQITITVHFGGSLGYKSKDHWETVEGGAVPLASTYTGVFAGIDPIFLLGNLPFMARNPIEARALVVAAEPWYQEAFAQGDQMLLFTAPWTPVGIWSKKKIASAADLKNLKIRTYDKNGTLTLKNAGAAAIQLSWADVVPALSTGTIDAVLTGAEGGISAKFYEYLDHFHYVNFTMGMQMIHIRKSLFDGLPMDLQSAVLEAAKETEDQVWAGIYDRIENNRKILADNNVTAVNDIPAEFMADLQRAGEPVLAEWREKMGEDVYQQIVDAYQAQLKK